MRLTEIKSITLSLCVQMKFKLTFLIKILFNQKKLSERHSEREGKRGIARERGQLKREKHRVFDRVTKDREREIELEGE